MKRKSFNKQSGQVLLIAVMLIAVTLTVVFSAAFVSRTDTQISKLEEENQKTLAAAEAGIEAALRTGTVADASTLNVPSGFTVSAAISTTSSPSFISPLIQKDDQYSFYLSEPLGAPDNPDFSILTSAYNNQPLTLCSSSSSFAMSAALLKSDGTIKRYMINPPASSIVSSGTSANGSGTCPSGITFTYRHQLAFGQVGSNNLLLIIRLVGTGTNGRIGIQGAINLPLQGRTVVSEAQSPTGVTKTVQLFQSYPQIPSEFFVTSF